MSIFGILTRVPSLTLTLVVFYEKFFPAAPGIVIVIALDEVTTIPNFREYISTRGLETVKPGSVRIIR
jgi:hypothetical protein